ncbi:MAG: outer membrane lipoprotein carrier protein LolA [Acetobacter sp.]|mgnify:CR=1 FL=1|jgi:outer membrane lipoprotein-sorting protein|nr:outer membrane lipoprotein carrier protein LolA [Acetobacter sp.]MCH4062684.1 outer membrane lipoprotein carrier protein LolA [Acetobacter sp.]MCH4088470.1 outer membrane lipoprotein carrier protein LolA [Acetobacter sp.]MCI1294626.1 outer membrane lipoprotein carrier protein LolA [Acetobacter sp.]MCI1321324.1 outer membrane lipoprotein carrier protein LolA [Acetobacter sp.]
MILSRRAALSGLLMGGLSACAEAPVQLSGEDRSAVRRVEDYLNGIQHFQADFVQKFPDGGYGNGVFVYSPGHLHMTYAIPHGTELTAGEGHLVFRNGQNGSVTRMGLSRNPLGLLLDTPIHLSGAVTVTNVVQQPGFLQISMARTAMLSEGLLTLQFNDFNGKLSLKGVDVVDERQHRTQLSLSNAG